MQKLWENFLTFKVDQNYSLDSSRLEEKDRLASHSRQEPEDNMSDTFEEYLEKSNMLCSQETGTEHYFMPNSHKSDFVWLSQRIFYVGLCLLEIL